MRRSLLLVVALLFFFSHLSHLWAAETIANPAIEARLKALATELRCLVCQNETLADSQADLAVDLRNEIRTLMVKGESNQQIIDYLVARYGDFVRFRPPLKPTTVALWFGPFILAVLGSAVLIFYLIRLRPRANTAPLSELEHQRLDSLLSRAEEDNKA